MKPIEPGCRAIIIGGLPVENIGKEVAVVRYVGAEEITLPKGDYVYYNTKPGWLCADNTFKLHLANTGDVIGDFNHIVGETQNLMRIDSDDTSVADTQTHQEPIHV